MGKRCGCAGTCSCAFQAGRGIHLSGAGSQRDPIMVEVVGGHAFVRGLTNNTIRVVVDGAGDPADPYRVHMDAFAGQRQPILYTFQTAGTYVWEKPVFGTFVRIALVGAGGGGGGANGNVPGGTNTYADSSTYHGVGGAPGVEADLELLLADLGAGTTVVVGGGGQGGPGVAGPGLPPIGAPGQMSSFGEVTAAGGNPGGILRPADGSRSPAPLGQGGQGGLSRSDTGYDGLDGGVGYLNQPGAGGTGAVATFATNGGAGPAGLTALRPRGGGGGGGVGSVIGSGNRGGGSGGRGGPGAGGGGGGVALTGVGGSGGAGGDGIIVILVQ